MALEMLEKAMSEIHFMQGSMDFCQLIRRAREAIGLMQKKAASFIGISNRRLCHLESGKFVRLPERREIVGIARLYGLDYLQLEYKVKQHCDNMSLRKN